MTSIIIARIWCLFAAAPLIFVAACFAADPKEKSGDALPELPPIEGTVVDAAGKPMANATIDVYRSDPIPDSLKSDAEGRFRVPGSWATGNRHTLIVRDGERIGWCSPFQQSYREKVGEKRVKIHVLPLTKKVRGTLVDPNGKPLTGVPIHVAMLSNGKNRSVMFIPQAILKGGKTDEKGEFNVLLPEASGAWLWPSDSWHVRIRIDVAAKGDDLDLGQIKVPEAAQIAGRVLDSSGKPVAGARIGAQVQNGTYSEIYLAGPSGAITDVEGKYRLSGILPGKYNVLFTAPEKNIKLTAPAKDGAVAEAKKETIVDLTAAEGRLLTGQLIDAGTGKGMPNCPVMYYGVARPRSGAGVMSCNTDAKGNFHFYLPPGTAYVYYSRGGQYKGPTDITLDIPERGDIKPIVLQVGPPELRVPAGTLKFRTIVAPELRLKRLMASTPEIVMNAINLRAK